MANTRSQRLLGTLGVIFVSGMLSAPAQAQPLVFVTTETTVLYENGTIVGLRHKRIFDELYSANAVETVVSHRRCHASSTPTAVYRIPFCGSATAARSSASGRRPKQCPKAKTDTPTRRPSAEPHQPRTWQLSLRRAVLPERRTGTTLGHLQLAPPCSMHARRREGLRSFPWQLPSGSACPA
jgi:hypothetical protein